MRDLEVGGIRVETLTAPTGKSKSRKLGAYWSPEAVADVRAFHSISAEEKLTEHHILAVLEIPRDERADGATFHYDLCKVGDDWKYIRLTEHPKTFSGRALKPVCTACVLLHMQREAEKT